MAERLVAVVGYEAAELLDIACVTTPLAMANGIGAPAVPYRVRLVGAGGGPMVCGTGLTLDSRPLERLVGPLDTLVVSGGVGSGRAAADPLLVAHVRRLARESRRVASVCTGAAVLAAAGLLDGRRATTHWRYARELADRHPEVAVDAAPIYVRDGNVYTAAGVTSALDLTLAFIEEDHGPELARQVARDLVVYLQRPGDQRQMSLFTAAPAPRGGPVGNSSGTSPRTPAPTSARRRWRRGRGHAAAPHPAVRPPAGTDAGPVRTAGPDRGRGAPARPTALPIAAVAARCGFGSAEALRQAFTRRYGVPPSRFRETARRPDGGARRG